jgi:hypothetical protein
MGPPAAPPAGPMPPSVLPSLPEYLRGLSLGAPQCSLCMQPLPASALRPAAPPPPPPPPPVECCVCFDPVATTELRALFPCGHRCVCEACAELLCARPPERRACPLCSEPVVGAMRVYDM